MIAKMQCLLVAFALVGFASSSSCPPDPASSMEEVDYHCPGAVSFFGNDDDMDSHRAATSYECYDESDIVSCKGSIDSSLQPLPCSADISSCSEDEFKAVCEGQPSMFSYCSGYFDDDVPVFRCWDRHANHWCQGSIVPSKGSFEEPMCPTEAIGSCDELEQYGIRHSYCSCSMAGGNHGKFSCPSKDGEPDWCLGFIGQPEQKEVGHSVTSPAKKKSMPTESPNRSLQNTKIAVLLLAMACFLFAVFCGVKTWQKRRFRRQVQELEQYNKSDEPPAAGYSDDVEMTGARFHQQGQWYW